MAKKKRGTESEQIARFRAFISEHGGEVLEPTNEYEVVRFRSEGTTSIIYRNRSGAWASMTGEASAAWSAFLDGRPYRLGKKTRRASSGRMNTIDKAIIARDGERCFYCDDPFEAERPKRRTREHLVSATHSGPNHISNLFHSCLACNQEAGHLSAPEKIRLRDRKREAKRTAQ